MRTPLTVATGLVLLAGVVVGVTTAASTPDDPAGIEPIRVEVPAVPGVVADVETAVPIVPERPQPDVAPAREAARDPNGYVAPPPADDDDDDDSDDDDGDDDDDDDGDG